MTRIEISVILMVLALVGGKFISQEMKTQDRMAAIAAMDAEAKRMGTYRVEARCFVETSEGTLSMRPFIASPQEAKERCDKFAQEVLERDAGL